ncbi:MAG: undecaprenyl-diphosphate phosphatase [Fibrobacteres bacterium]|nr:undecaprenyl-diphosphate phosphatase [Fibrobacterota bacterium]
METILSAVILGIVEGITEFLPISSTGHLIIVNRFINFSDRFASMFDVVIQLGAILAVVVYFWDRLYPFSKTKDAESRKAVWALWKKAVIGVTPALAIGLVAGDTIEEKLFNPTTVSIALFIGGILLILLERRKKEIKYNSVADLKISTVIAIGFIQCLAMIPGTSRAAATIIGAMLLGSSRALAAEFSFFLAIPTMTAASGYTLLKHGGAMTSIEMAALATGFVVSFFVAWAVISLFMNYIKKHDFRPFAYYRIALAVVILVLLALGIM